MHGGIVMLSEASLMVVLGKVLGKEEKGGGGGKVINGRWVRATDAPGRG